MTTELQPAKPDKQIVKDVVTAVGKLIVEDHGAASYLFDTARFEHMQRIATAMAAASLIPDHLRGKGPNADRQTIGNCLLIVNQAVRWHLDPFAVAPETYVVRGKLGFQGKLVAAVVNSRAGLVGRLSYSFSGEGDGRSVDVSGQFADEAEPREVTLSVRQAKTDNTMWLTDPDQKLVYSGATKWARRHCPEVMLGVLTSEDLEHIAMDTSWRAQPSYPEPEGGGATIEDLVKPQTAPEKPPEAVSGPQTPEAEKAAEKPHVPGIFVPSTPAPEPPEKPHARNIMENGGIGVHPAPEADAEDEENSIFAEIASCETIGGCNAIEKLIDLDSPAAARLKKACANQRVVIRQARGGKRD